MPTASQPSGLRERKNRRTRQTIVRAAAELTIEEGYNAATIARIAERADVAPRTVSTWFPAKEDILFDGTAEHLELAIGHLRSDAGDVVDRIEAWFAEERTREPVDREIARLRLEAIEHDPQLRARELQEFEAVGDAVARAAAEHAGGEPTDMGPQLVAASAIRMLQVLRAQAFHSLGREPPDVENGFALLRSLMAATTAGYSTSE